MKFNKKLLSIFFIAMLTVVLAACGGTTTTEAPTTQAPTTAAPTTQAPTTQAPTTQAPTTTAEPYDFTAAVAALKTHYADTLDSDTFEATGDLTLIDEISGVDVSWASSNTDYVANDGTVTRPTFTEGQQTVIMTATLTVGSETEDVTFFVSIKALDKSDQERANEVFLVVTAFPNKEKWTSADSYYVDDDGKESGLTFLTEGKDADDVTYTVTWTSSHPDIISVDGEINQDVDSDVTVTMTASVTINSVEYTKDVVFVVAKVVDPTDVATIAAAKALYTTNNPTGDFNHTEYVRIPGVTIVGVGQNGLFVTDGVDILYVYAPPAPFDSLEEGDVINIIGQIKLFYNAWELDGSDMEPMRWETSTAAVKTAPTTVAATILDLIGDMTMPSAANPFSNTRFTVTAKVYYNSAWGNYSVFLVPVDYDFDAPLQTGATQPNGDSIMIYYSGNDEVLRAFHGKEVTIDIIMDGYRTDKLVWYGSFFGTAEDVQLSFANDTDAVDAVIASLKFPYSIIEDETLSLVTGLYGATVTYTSTDNALINPTTGVVTVTGLTEQTSVTITASVNRGDVTKAEDFVIKLGPLPMSDVEDVYTTLEGDLIKVTGVLTTSTKAYQYFFQDDTAGVALDVYDWQTEFGAIALGSEIIITGEVDKSSGLFEIVVIDYEVQTTTPALPAAADINAVDFTDAALLAYQGQLVAFSGFVLQELPTVDTYGTYKFTLMDIVNDKEIFVMLDNRSVGYADAKTELLTLEAGDEVVITGAVLGWYNGYQLLITEASQFEKGTNGLTDQQKLDLDIENDLPATIVLTEDAEIPTAIYGSTYTITKVVGNIENYLDFTTTPGEILVTLPTAIDVTGYFEIEVENGTASEMVTIDVTITSEPLDVITELFISEYGEGSSGNNKWLEIYNGTGSDVDLSNYSLVVYSNGATAATRTYNMTGTLVDGDVFVITRVAEDTVDAALLAEADVMQSYNDGAIAIWNGNDAVALLKDGVLIDVIGVIGEDPGTEWTWDGGSTKDKVLVRKDSILSPNSTFTTSEWDVLADMTFTEVGSHTAVVTEVTDAIRVLVDSAELDLGAVIVSETEITLPTAGVMGSAITWTIKTDAGSNATLVGNVLTLNAVETDAVVVIEATLTLGDTTPVTETSHFTYYLNGFSAAERVAADLAELVDAELDQDLYVASDVDLPTMGSFGSAITWEITTDVDSMATLDEAGDTVSFLNATLAETTVTLTATVTYGTESDTTTVTYTLKAYPIVDLVDFADQSDGDIVVVTGYVFAVINGGYFIEDGTGTLYVYDSTAYNVGDEVFLTGEVDYSYGEFRLRSLLEAPAALSTGNVVTQTPVEYVHGTTELVSGQTYLVRGTVAIEGQYSNVYIYVNDTDSFEIFYQSPAASIDALEALVGKEIFVEIIYLNGDDTFAYVGGTEGYSEILTDFSVLHAMTDGTNYDIPNGTEVYISGVVAAIAYSGTYVQDANGVGLYLYGIDDSGLTVGDQILVSGITGANNGVREIGTVVIISNESSDNALVYNEITADEIIALDATDAGKLVKYTGLEVVSYSGSYPYAVTFKVTGTTETIELTHRFYSTYAEWLPKVFEVGDILPEVTFIYADYRDSLNQIDVLGIEFTDAYKIEADANSVPTDLIIEEDYTIPTGDYGSTYTVTGITGDAAAYLDYTTTAGLIAYTAPASDVTGVIAVEVSLNTETVITKNINVVVKAPIVVLYSTGFESTEGFTASTSYSGTQTYGNWTVVEGTVTTTDGSTTDQHIQMRDYSTTEQSFPYTQYNSTVAFNSIRFNSYSNQSSGFQLLVQFSTDGTTWSTGLTIDLTNSDTMFELDSDVTDATYIRFTVQHSVTPNKQRVNIDDVILF
jgi:hypothetical protein